MATLTIKHTALKRGVYGSNSWAEDGIAAQGQHQDHGGSQVGLISFGEGLLPSNSVSKIEFEFTFNTAGTNANKKITFYGGKTTMNSPKTVLGDELGEYIVDGAYNATRTITLTEGDLFNNLVEHFTTTGYNICIYNGETTSSGWTTNYLKIEDAKLIIEYNPLILRIDPDGGYYVNEEGDHVNTSYKFIFDNTWYYLPICVDNTEKGETFTEETIKGYCISKPIKPGYQIIYWHVETVNGDDITDQYPVSPWAMSVGTVYAIYNIPALNTPIKVKAIWGPSSSEPTNITVTFDANGGTSSFTSATKMPGEAYDSLPTATRTGYKFKGWYSANSGGQEITSTSVVPGYDHTLYARWEETKLKINYHKNGAINGTFQENQITKDIITSITVKYSDWLVNGLANYNNKNSAYLYLNRPGYRGKPGKEWCTKNDGSGITIDEATQYYGFELANDLDISIAHNDQEITLYANWEPWGVVRIYTDSGWKQAIPFVYDGTGWKQAIPFVYDGTDWKASV